MQDGWLFLAPTSHYPILAPVARHVQHSNRTPKASPQLLDNNQLQSSLDGVEVTAQDGFAFLCRLSQKCAM